MERWKEELDRFALRLHRMGLGTVAMFILESMKPLSGVFLNLGVFGRPFVDLFVPKDIYDRLLEVLEDRDKVEYLIDKLEELEDGTLVADGSDRPGN